MRRPGLLYIHPHLSRNRRLLFRHELRDVQKLWEQRHGYAARERKQPTLVEMFTQASPPSKRKQSEGDDQGSPAK